VLASRQIDRLAEGLASLSASFASSELSTASMLQRTALSGFWVPVFFERLSSPMPSVIASVWS
jgi:hypothetical protein